MALAAVAIAWAILSLAPGLVGVGDAAWAETAGQAEAEVPASP